MKRHASNIITLSCGRDVKGTTTLVKRRKTSFHESTTKKSISQGHQVRFATPLVVEKMVPALVDEEEKNRLHYSSLDFARFAIEERIRRDSFVLTVKLFRKQTRRMQRGQPVIPYSTISLMYSKLMSRPETIPKLAERKINRLATAGGKVVRPKKQYGRISGSQQKLTNGGKHVVVAGAA